MNIVIRKANVEDSEQIKELMLQYIVDFYQQPEPENLDVFLAHLFQHPASGLQLVAEEEGKLIGFATLYFTFSTLKAKRTAILNDLFVKHEARGKKVGEKLFQACLNYIRENDFASMTWETAKDNKIAQALYEKMGAHPSKWLVYDIS